MHTTEGNKSTEFQGGANILFHSPGCDPFHVSNIPNSNYFPSKLLESDDQFKNTILKPEKLPKLSTKDDDSYEPLSYSFCEESEDDSISKLLTSPTDQPFPLSKITSSSETSSNKFTSISNQSTLIKETSRQQIGGKSLNDQISLDTRIDICEEDLESYGNLALKPKMSSTQKSSDSNIKEMINRFRYGKPRPPSERKSSFPRSVSNSSKPPSSGVNKRYDWLDSDAFTSSNVTADANPGESPTPHEDSFQDLQERVERLLKESTNTLNEQPLTIPSSTWTSISEEGVSMNQEKSSGSADSNGSKLNSSTSASSSRAFHTEKLPIHQSNSTKSITSSLISSTSLSPSPPCLQAHQPPFSQALQPPSPKKPISTRCVVNRPVQSSFSKALKETPGSNLPFHEDILQQWRLRRKMELAHDALNDPFLKDTYKRERKCYKEHEVDDKVRCVPAEKPLDRPSSNTKSIGISVIPMVTTQTQTSPPSSHRDPMTSPTPPSISLKEDDEISLHNKLIPRVTIMPCNGSTPKPDVISPSASTTSRHSSTSKWSLKKPKNCNKHEGRKLNKKHEMVEKSQMKDCSPTTTVVRKVVGLRLFDTSSETLSTLEGTQQPHSSTNDTFNSTCSEHTNSYTGKLLHKSIDGKVEEDDVHVRESSQVEELLSDAMISNLIQSIESDVDDFPSDPVLTSLRQQRRKFLRQLQLIEEKLETNEKGN